MERRQQTFREYDKESKGNTPLMEEVWVVLCQAMFQSIKGEEWMKMYEKLEDVIRKSDAKKGAQRCASQGKVVWTKTLKESFLSVKEESVQVFQSRSALRESLLSI